MASKHRKSITMSDKLFKDLNHLCDVLGVNSHSYILNVVAREVHRDLVGHKLRTPPSSAEAERLLIETNYDVDTD